MYDGCRVNGASFRTPLEENSIDNQPQMRYDSNRHDGSNFITTTIEEPNPVNDVRMIEDGLCQAFKDMKI